MRRYARAFLIGLAVMVAPVAAFATQVQEVTSAGGMKAWLVEEHSLPLVAVKLAFKDSGSAYEPVGKEGLVSMTAALMLEGAGDLDSNAFNAQIEGHAIQLNFGVDEDTFGASMECLSEHKEKAFEYMSLALRKPRFDSSAIERVRSQTLSVLLQQEQEPGYQLHRHWEQLAFGSHPYGAPTLGTKESIGSIGKSDLVHFTDHYLSKENLVIAVVGDITPAELKTLLDKHLGTLNDHYTADIKVDEVTLPAKGQQVVVDFDIPQTMILFGANGLKREDPDYYAAHVMNQIVGGGGALNSLLGDEVRQKRGLAYGIGTQLAPMVHGAAWMGSVATRNEKVGEVLQVLRKTLKDFSHNGPSDKQMDDAKKHIIGSFVMNLDSNASIANFLINMQINHLGIDYLDKRNALMQAVRKDKVKAVAAKLLDPDQLLVVIVGKPHLEIH